MSLFVRVCAAEEERDEAKQALAAAGGGAVDSVELVTLRNKVKALEAAKSQPDQRLVQLQEEIKGLQEQLQRSKSTYEGEIARLKASASTSSTADEINRLQERIKALEKEKAALEAELVKAKAGGGAGKKKGAASDDDIDEAALMREDDDDSDV